jgi:hypothetical protein
MKKILFIIAFNFIVVIGFCQNSYYVEALPFGFMVHENKIGLFGSLVSINSDFGYIRILNYYSAKDAYLDYLSFGLSLPFMANEGGVIKLNGGIALNTFWKKNWDDYDPFDPQPDVFTLTNIPGRVGLEYNSFKNIFNVSIGYQKSLHYFENEYLNELNSAYHTENYDGVFLKMTLNIGAIMGDDAFDYSGTYFRKIGSTNKYKPPKKKKTKTIKKIESAVLNIQTINFIDENKNNRIDGDEVASINMIVRNTGNVPSGNLTVYLKEQNRVKGLIYQQVHSVTSIAQNYSQQIKLSVKGDDNLETNLAHFIIEIKEGNKPQDKAEIEIPTQKQVTKKIQIGYISDIDINIPETEIKNENTFAVIIGNEDYSSRQPNLSKESNVPYAINDADIFYSYATRTLGIPAINITLLKDATSSEMYQAVDKLNLISKLKDGKSRLIFYYAGHGLPDQDSKIQYLIPVDVSSSNIQYGINLNDLLDKLTNYPSEQVTVILDACFSGGAREVSLLSDRGIKITPKDIILKGNIVVLASSSGDEASQSYTNQNHGMFTYFLLKKLQETKGNVTYKELANYLEEKIMLQSVLINSNLQTPSVKISPDISDEWEDWKLK